MTEIKAIFFSVLLMAAFSRAAEMPSAEEVTAAQALVQEVMSGDMAAMRAGKKARKDVAASAMEISAQAETAAEKLVLLRTAFNLYMKDGAYAEAEKAYAALTAAVPAYPADELQALLEKALLPVKAKDAANIRALLADLKAQASLMTQIKRLKASVAKTPGNVLLHTRLAFAYVQAGDWKSALPEFTKGDNTALASAAKLELASEPLNKVADAWWTAELAHRDSKHEPLVRTHAADLYTAALPSLTGLVKVAAEKRIQESRESAENVSERKSLVTSVPNLGAAKFVGVKVKGDAVKCNNGVLSGFLGSASYAYIDTPFAPANSQIEAVIEFTTAETIPGTCGLMGCVGGHDGFTPFYVAGGQVCGYLSSTGKAWNIASAFPLGLKLAPKQTYRLKCSWDGKEYAWFLWNGGRWTPLATIPSNLPVAGGADLQLGTNRGQGAPFNGTIDLNRSYIKVGGKLWWEGVKGAYRNANR